MSRLVNAWSQLSTPLGSTRTFGTQTTSIFFWYYRDPWNSGDWVNSFPFWLYSTLDPSAIRARCFIGWNATNDVDRVNLGVSGEATAYHSFTPGTYAGQWIPVLVSFQIFPSGGSGDQISDFWAGYKFGETPKNWNGVTYGLTYDTLAVGDSAVGRSFNISHLTMWDRALNATDWATLTTLDGANYPNPTTVQSSDILSYWSFENDNLTSEFGTDVITLVADGGTTSYDASLSPTVTPINVQGPDYINPGTIINKVGDTISIDTSSWFSSVDGTPVYDQLSDAVLPSGININSGTGELSGTLPSTEDLSFEASFTITDDVGTTTANFIWEYSDWVVKFEGNTRLESPGGSIYSGTVAVSVIDGDLSQDLSSANIDDIGTSESVVNGYLEVVVTGSGNKIVFIQGTGGDSAFIGAYQLTAQ